MQKILKYPLVLGLTLLSGCGLSLSRKSVPAVTGGVSAKIKGSRGVTGPSYPMTGPASSWVGINADADLPYCDLAHNLGHFDATSIEADGLPSTNVNGVLRDDTNRLGEDIGYILPTGDYKVSFKGTGSVDISGIGALVGGTNGWQTVNGETRGLVHIDTTPNAWGRFLNITITNVPAKRVTDLHFYLPTCEYNDPHLFNSTFIKLLTPFRELRMMSGWLGTNNSTIVKWDDRPVPKKWGSSIGGQPYENIVELINETGKDAWINIPEQASEDYVTNLGGFLREHLDFTNIDKVRKGQGITNDFELIVEFSNETWNGGFSAYGYLLGVANANPTRYPGIYSGTLITPWDNPPAWRDQYKVAQVQADKLVRYSQLLKTELSQINRDDIVKPVMTGWTATAILNEVQLKFVQDHYGTPKEFIAYSGLDSYFGPAHDSVVQPDMDHLFDDIKADIDGKKSVYDDMKGVLSKYEVKMVSYEGGDGNGNTLQNRIAQYDSRMVTAYNQMFALWKQEFGKALFNQFSLVGSGGAPQVSWQWGLWGAVDFIGWDPDQCTQNLQKWNGDEDPYSNTVRQYCPKYKALADQATE